MDVCMPVAGGEVTVHYGNGRRRQAVVLSARLGQLVVNAPALSADGELRLSWAGPHGLTTLPARVHTAGSERCVLTPSGRPHVDQRRAYFRVGVDRPMGLRPMTLRVATSAKVNALVSGRLVDVSEAALQCSLPDGTALPEGTRVLSYFTLQGSEFAVPGRVVSRERQRVVVRFEHDRREADALRGRVFAAELAARRAAGDAPRPGAQRVDRRSRR